MKKVIAILLAAVMLFGLAACSNKQSEEQPTENTFTTSSKVSPTAAPATLPDETNTDDEQTAEPVGSTDENNNEEESEMQNPQITITMEDGGVMVAELYPDIAPNTVNNFISLAKKGFYDGLIFHRVIQGFMLQGGDPNGTGTGGPGYSIKGEFTANGFENDLKHTPGVLSMARATNPNSAGSQFFVMTANADWLDGQYAAFGKVIEGMDVAYRIETTPTDSNDRPKTEQKIKTITVETFGVDYPEPSIIK